MSYGIFCKNVSGSRYGAENDGRHFQYKNAPIFLDMVRELFVGLKSKAKSNMADISWK